MPRTALLALLALAACNDSGLTVNNAPPRAAITSHADGDVVYAGQAVTFRGTASDPDRSDTLQATWFAGESVLCPATVPDDDRGTSCEAVLEADQTEITLEVRDASGDADTARVTLVVVPDEVPVVTITEPDDGAEVWEEDLLLFEGRVSDAEDPAADLDVWWTSSLQGDLDVEAVPDANGDVSGSGTLDPGQHEITLHATDAAGNEGTSSVVVTVRPTNQAPTCAITAPEDGAVGEAGETVTFEGTVGDAEDDPGDLAVEWRSDRDGPLGASTADGDGAVSLATATLSEATHVVSLVVTDAQGATCTDTVLYTVGTPPRIALAAPADGDLVDEGDEVLFEATVTDPDHAASALAMRWESDVDGVLSTAALDSAGHVAFTRDDLSRGTHAISVTATDPDGFYDREVVVLTVNGLPSAPTVALTPDPAYTDDDLVVTITSGSVDPDGEAVTYTYAWYRNGTLRSAYTTDTVPASATARGETWRVVVTPADPHGSGTPGEDSLTVQNSAPTAPVVSIAPEDPVEGEDALVCSIDTASSDADGDSISTTFAWTVDGVRFTGTSTTTRAGDTVPATATEAEEEWTCSVTPSDGTLSGTAGTDTVSVLGVPVDYAHLQYPCSASIARTTGTLDVYCWVYQPGVTDAYGEGAGITVDVGVGDDGSDPRTDASWTWTAAAYNEDKPAYGDSSADPPPYNNDEYLGTLSAPSSTGSFDYACRVSTDSGLSWVYVDLGGTTCGGDGTIDGYDPADAGDLTVYP